jgi:hypothetical protein
MSNSFSENLRQRFNKKISLKRKEATPPFIKINTGRVAYRRVVAYNRYG